MGLSQDLKVQIAGDATKLISSVDAGEKKLVSLGNTSSTVSQKIISSNRQMDDSFLATSKAQEAAATAILRANGQLDDSYRKQVQSVLDSAKAQGDAARAALTSNQEITASEREALLSVISSSFERQKAAMVTLGAEKQIQAAAAETAATVVSSNEKVIASNEESSSSFEGLHKHALAGAAAVTGLFGGYEAAKGAVSDTIDLGKATAFLSTSTGASITQSSELVGVMQSLGVNTSAASQTIKALSKANEAQITSTGTTVTAFDKLGISQQEAVAHSHDYVGLLELVADRLKTVSAGTEKTTLLQQLFGKSYQTIEPLIRNGSAGLQEALATAEKYGVTLNSKTLPQVLALAQAEKVHSQAMLGLKVAFTEVAGKPMIDFEDHLTNIANDIRSSSWGDLSKQTTELGSGLEKVIQNVTPKVEDAFAQAAPKMLSGLWSGFEHADTGAELIIGALVVKKLFSTAVFTLQGAAAAKSFFGSLGEKAAVAAPVEGAIAGKEFAGAFDAAAAEGIAVAGGAAGAGGGILAGSALGGALTKLGGSIADFLGSAVGLALGGVLGAKLGSDLEHSLPGEGNLSAAPGESLGGGKIQPGVLNGNRGGFVAASGTNYSKGEEPVIASRLNALAQSLGVTLTGISGYRTPAHSVAVGGFADDPHTKGLASDTQGAQTIPESTLEKYGLTRPFPGAAEADHIQLLPGYKGNGILGAIAGAATNASITGSSTPSLGGSSAPALKPCLLTYYDPRQGGINIADPKHPYALANGDTWSPSMMGCAAPPAYAFGTQIQFVYKGRSVMATVVDRGGAIQGNHFDLQPAPAQALGMMSAGKVNAQFRVVGKSANGAANAAGQATTLADTQSSDFANYQQATSDVGLELQAGQITQGQADAQDKTIGASALKGGFGSLDSHMLLQVKADIAGATSGASALKQIESAAQKRVLSAGHGMASKESALVSKYSTAVAKLISNQQHTESLQALFPTDLSTVAGAATAIGNLKEQKAAKSHVKDIYTDELNAIKKEIAAWVKSRDTYRTIARKSTGKAKTTALQRAAGLQAEIDQGQADADTIGGNISDTAVEIESLDVQITQTTADAATAQAQAAQTGLDNDFAAYQSATSDIQLQVDAGVLTPDQGTAATLAAGQKALNGGFGALSQQSIWQVMADMKNATQDNTTALEANTQAQLDATTVQLQYTEAAQLIANVGTNVAIKALADVISGQIVGIDLSGRSGTAGDGSAARY